MLSCAQIMFICAGRSAAANREGCWNEACVCLLNFHSQTHAQATIAKLQAAIQRIDALQGQGKYDQVAKECAKWLPQIDPDDLMFLYFHTTQEEALSRLGRYDKTICGFDSCRRPDAHLLKLDRNPRQALRAASGHLEQKRAITAGRFLIWTSRFVWRRPRLRTKSVRIIARAPVIGMERWPITIWGSVMQMTRQRGL